MIKIGITYKLCWFLLRRSHFLINQFPGDFAFSLHNFNWTLLLYKFNIHWQIVFFSRKCPWSGCYFTLWVTTYHTAHIHDRAIWMTAFKIYVYICVWVQYAKLRIFLSVSIDQCFSHQISCCVWPLASMELYVGRCMYIHVYIYTYVFLCICKVALRLKGKNGKDGSTKMSRRWWILLKVTVSETVQLLYVAT